MAIYQTRDGDMLDKICVNYYGQSVDRLEAVLAANPGLAAYDAPLPSNIKMVLPDRLTPVFKQPTIRLWS